MGCAISGPVRRGHHRGFFGPVVRDRPVGKLAVLYLALVARDELAKRTLSEIEASRELSLVDLTGKGLQHAGVTGDVSTAPHEETWALSRAIHEHPRKPDGIRYRLKHDLGRIGIAIFDRVAIAELQVISRGSLADPSNAALLGRILEEYDKGYI
jgi:hypothetical protein